MDIILIVDDEIVRTALISFIYESENGKDALIKVNNILQIFHIKTNRMELLNLISP